MRYLILILTLICFSGIAQAKDWPSGSSTGIPGITGSTGDESTIAYLYNLREFVNPSSQLMATQWVDPVYGSDTAGDGSYDNPYFSLRKIKSACLDTPNSHCRVKGRDKWFTHSLLTLTYSGGVRHLLQGEVVTFTDPAGTAEVLAVYENKVAVTWLSGDEPRDTNTATNTTFDAGSGESAGTVTAVQDSIAGVRSWVIENADVTTGTDSVISAVGHDYSTGDGPFLFYSAATFPTFGTDSISADGEFVYVCGVVANTSFTLANESTCTNILDITSVTGTGDMQLIYGQRIVGSSEPASTVQTIGGTSGCADTDRICILFDSEFPESPWGIDGNRLYPNGAYANIVSGGFWPGLCDDKYDTGGPPQTSGSPDLLCDSDGSTQVGDYNTATGGILAVEPATDDPEQNGWFGMQNGIIQNISHDAIFGNAGAKIVALNVKCRGIRNGAGDRSQTGYLYPADQAHNSCLSMAGENSTDANLTASVAYWINGGDSWSEFGSDDGSGALLNINQNASAFVITQGRLLQDAVSGDTCAGSDNGSDNTLGVPCPGNFIVQVGGDLSILGPQLIHGATADGSATSRPSFLSFTGTTLDGDQRLRIYNSVVEFLPASPASQPTVGILGWSGGAQGMDKFITVRNSTFTVPNGHAVFLIGCPLRGTDHLTADSTITVDMKGILLDGWNSSSDYMMSMTDCGLGATYTWTSTVARAFVSIEGIWDQDDRSGTVGCADGPRFRYSASSPCVGDEVTANTFLERLLTLGTDPAGNSVQSGQWTWMSTNSADSGGVGVDGLQWTSGDPHYRCVDGNECWQADTLSKPDYVVSLRSLYGNSDVSCLPADVLGSRICAFTITPTNGAGGR